MFQYSSIKPKVPLLALAIVLSLFNGALAQPTDFQLKDFKTFLGLGLHDPCSKVEEILGPTPYHFHYQSWEVISYQERKHEQKLDVLCKDHEIVALELGAFPSKSKVQGLEREAFEHAQVLKKSLGKPQYSESKKRIQTLYYCLDQEILVLSYVKKDQSLEEMTMMTAEQLPINIRNQWECSDR